MILKMYFLIIHELIDLDYSDCSTVTPERVATRGHNFRIIMLKNVDLIQANNFFSNRCVNIVGTLYLMMLSIAAALLTFLWQNNIIEKHDLREFLMGRTLGN